MLKEPAGAVRRAGLALGTFMLALTLLFIVGEGPLGETPLVVGALTAVERLMFAALFGMMLGTLVAWRWTLAGSLLILAGGLSFVAINSVGSGRFRVGGPFPPLYLLAGALLFVAWLLRDRAQSKDSRPPLSGE